MKSILQVVQNLLKPYIDRNIETATGVLGAKNVGAFSYTTETKTSGIPVTFTVGATGIITVSGSGTVGSTSVSIVSTFNLPKGTYILSGCPNGGGTSSYRIILLKSSGGAGVATDNGDGVTFTLNEATDIAAYVEIRPNYTFSGSLEFKPMIRPASIEDDTYVPYAKTNYVLTRNIQHNINGAAVGYYAKRTYQASEMANVSQGSITIANANGIGTVILSNVVCTPDVALLDVSGYFGSGRYVYDENVSGIIIDNSRLICRSANMGYRILTFIM